MTDETDTSFWDTKPGKMQTPPKRRPKRKMRGVRNLHAEIRELKEALKAQPQQSVVHEVDAVAPAKAATALKRVVPTDDSMFEGLEPRSCANRCGNGFCVITHDENCAHPMTSPLQQTYFNNSEVLARYKRAQKYCAAAKMRLDDLLREGLGL